VWLDGLYYKLYEIGVTGKLWRIIKHLYDGIECLAMFQVHTSEKYKVNKGVGQGRVLSVFFFSVYINDLLYNLQSTHCGLKMIDIDIPAVLLADDTSLFSTSPSGLQSLISENFIYACKRRLKFNSEKVSS